VVHHGNYDFTVLEMEKMRILRIKLTILEK
jgi:hypothetical protein